MGRDGAEASPTHPPRHLRPGASGKGSGDLAGQACAVATGFELYLAR